MRRNHLLSAALFLVPALLSGCGVAPSSEIDDVDAPGATEAEKPGAELHGLLAALPRAHVALADDAGVPSFLTGHLGLLEIEGDPAAADLRGALAALAPVFRASADDLVLKRAQTDTLGDVHFRFSQRKNGLPVIGAEIAVHVRDGMIYAANGDARDDLPAESEPSIDAADAIAAARDASASIVDATVEGEPQLAYHRSGDKLELVYVVEVVGAQADGTPAHDSVLVSAADRSLVARHPHVHTAKNREVHNLNHGTGLPGPLARAEGDPANADVIVNNNYYRIGMTYDCLYDLFGRDSYNDAGAKIISSVHYSSNYVNAFWNGSQIVFGDGDGVASSNLANSLDVTAHELGHAVTSNTSGLIYSGESGGLNEAMSDIIGNVCEWFQDGMVVSADTWLVGEEVWTPATAGDALRYMDDPALDGASLDWYPAYAPGVDVHYSSGIANLAFHLLAAGGSHPRGKSAVVVNGIGMEKAAQIFYYANAFIMGPATSFPGAKIATEIAAQQLGYSASDVAAVTAAWQAVGVGLPPGPGNVVLVNNSTQLDLDGALASARYFTVEVPPGATNLTISTAGGATGDADLYVSHAEVPTLTSYDCRPFLGGVSPETCTFNSPVPGTYHVMLQGYSAYTGVDLSVSYQAGLQNGQALTSLSGVPNSQVFWTFNVPAGKSSLVISTSDGAGDSDLYVRRGAQPTTFTYDCRPYLGSTSETCSWSNPASGTYHVMLRGFRSYAGVTLKAQYQ